MVNHHPILFPARSVRLISVRLQQYRWRRRCSLQWEVQELDGAKVSKYQSKVPYEKRTFDAFDEESEDDEVHMPVM